MIKKRVSLFSIGSFFCWALVCSVIGLALPNLINSLNGFDYYARYGYIASYLVAIGLFHTLTNKWNFYVKRESYIVKIGKLFFIKDKRGKK